VAQQGVFTKATAQLSTTSSASWIEELLHEVLLLPLIAIPVGLTALLTGAALATSRRGLTMLPQSPIRGILLVRWTRFVRTMARHPRSYDSPRGRLGAFGMDARRLSDVGLCNGPKKATVGGELGVWTATWKKPLTKEHYLQSLPVQYAAFRRSMQLMIPKVSGFVGCDVEGSRCTLSGLLGVGHLAGQSGVESWVKDASVRKKFKQTTETFNLTNGIF